AKTVLAALHRLLAEQDATADRPFEVNMSALVVADKAYGRIPGDGRTSPFELALAFQRGREALEALHAVLQAEVRRDVTVGDPVRDHVGVGFEGRVTNARRHRRSACATEGAQTDVLSHHEVHDRILF